MADIVDMAAEIEAEHLSAAIARARQPVAAGVPGACDDCGEDSARLVEGRCAFCRDGRRKVRPASSGLGPTPPAPPPLPRRAPPVPTPPPPAPPVAQPMKVPMDNPREGKRQITFFVTGELLAAIEARAGKEGLSLGRAARAFAEAGLSPPTGADAFAEPDDRPALLRAWADRGGSLEALFDGLADRVTAAEARAAAAEGRLVKLREALA